WSLCSVARMSRPTRWKTTALLAQLLHKRGYSLEISRVPWAEQGWRRALRDADKRFAEQRGGWVLVQYTALAWSRRGFSLRFARMIDGLKGTLRCCHLNHRFEDYWEDRRVA